MTLTANSNGNISGSFTVPANVAAGSKLVRFQGSQTVAEASYIGRGVLNTTELQSLTTIVNTRTLDFARRVDPLAQTFMLNARMQIAAVDLWFTAKGSSRVLMQIRGVTLGLPNATIVAESILPSAQISTVDVTRFKFPPVVLEENQEYCIVIMCDDAVTAVSVGELGKFDAIQQAWVTSQPYTVGVLLSSSNNSTWAAHQAVDLTFMM